MLPWLMTHLKDDQTDSEKVSHLSSHFGSVLWPQSSCFFLFLLSKDRHAEKEAPVAGQWQETKWSQYLKFATLWKGQVRGKWPPWFPNASVLEDNHHITTWHNQAVHLHTTFSVQAGGSILRGIQGARFGDPRVALPFLSCGNLGMLHRFIVPLFPHLKNQHNYSTYLKDLVVEDYMGRFVQRVKAVPEAQ